MTKTIDWAPFKYLECLLRCWQEQSHPTVHLWNESIWNRTNNRSLVFHVQNQIGRRQSQNAGNSSHFWFNFISTIVWKYCFCWIIVFFSIFLFMHWSLLRFGIRVSYRIVDKNNCNQLFIVFLSSLRHIRFIYLSTAGQEKFRAMTPMYYRNANAALLVFDLTNYNSFVEVKGWVQELHKWVLFNLNWIEAKWKLSCSTKR